MRTINIKRKVIINYIQPLKSFKENLNVFIDMLFKEAKKQWEYEVQFGRNKYIRLTDDWYSYIELWSKWTWLLCKRSKEDIKFILEKLCK